MLYLYAQLAGHLPSENPQHQSSVPKNTDMKQTKTTKRTNRFFARSAKRAALAQRSPRVALAAPEIDALESRLLLSGIVEGKDYKKLTYKDLDGDKVTIKMTKGGTFQVAGEFDGKTALTMDQITITKATANSVFSIDVAKVKPTGDGNGSTNIGVLTGGNVDFKAIRLNGSSIDSISLSETDLSQGATLQAKAAVILDRTSAGGQGAVNLINWGAVSLNSTGFIQSQTVSASLVGNNPALNFNGPITVNQDAVSITGRTSVVNGAINVQELSSLNVAGLNGALTTVGSLTLNLANGQSIAGANINVGGDLHLGVLSGGLYGTTFNVVGSISGADTKVMNDAVSINGEVYGVTFNAGQGGAGAFAGLTVVGGDIFATAVNTPDTIGDITAKQGAADFGGLVAKAIGDITVRDALTIGTTGIQATAGDVGSISAASIGGLGFIDAIGGSVGNITTTKGDLSLNVTADVAIGNVTSAGAVANLEAGVAESVPDKTAASGGNIGNITAKGFVGTVTAFAGGIGDITVTKGAFPGFIGTIIAGTDNTNFAAVGGDVGKITLAGGTLGAVTVAKGSLGDVTIVDGSLNGPIFVGSDKVGKFDKVGGDIGSITVATDKTTPATAIAASITALNGAIGDVKATALGVNAIGLNGNLTALTTIGNIEATATGLGGIGMGGGLTVAAAKIGNVTALGTAVTAGGQDAVAVNGNLTLGVATLDTGTTSIGNVGITGAFTGALNLIGISAVTAPAINTGATAGNITMVSNSADNPLVVNTTDVRTLGNVSLTGGLGALTITSAAGGVELQAIGNITSGNALDVSGLNLKAAAAPFLGSVVGNIQAGGQLTAGAGLAALTVGTFTVGGFTAPGGVVNNIGNGGVGGSIGQITVGNDVAGAVGNNYTFTFDNYNGAPNNVIINTAPQTLNAVAAPGVTSAAGGLVFVLV